MKDKSEPSMPKFMSPGPLFGFSRWKSRRPGKGEAKVGTSQCVGAHGRPGTGQEHPRVGPGGNMDAKGLQLEWVERRCEPGLQLPL